MNSFLIFAVLLPLAAAAALWLLRNSGDGLSDGLTCLTALVELVLAVLIRMQSGTADLNGVLHSGLHFTARWGGIAVFAALAFVLVTLARPAGNESGKRGPRPARLRCGLMVGLSGAMGVFYAADFMTMYLFLMVLSLASCIWVYHPETEASRKAADPCLAVTMISGLTLLYGLFLLHHTFETLNMEVLSSSLTPSTGAAVPADLLLPGICLLIGFGARAAAFPFHVWLPGAADHGYGGALFTGVLTAAGVHGIRLAAATVLLNDERFAVLLLALGMATLVFAGICAVYATEFKRLLVWVAVGQVGMALMAAGLESTGMSLAHAEVTSANLILSMTALFVMAHVLNQKFGTTDLNILKGAGNGNPLLTILFLLPALSLSGVPGLIGYRSLAALHASLTLNGLPAAVGELAQAGEGLLCLGGGLMVAALLKIFVKVFLQPRETGTAVRPAKEALIAMLVPALLLPVLGLLPERFDLLPGLTPLSFAPPQLIASVIILAAGGVLYLVFVRGLRTDKISGDYTSSESLVSLENDIWGNLLRVLAFVGALLGRLCYSLTDFIIRLCDKLLHLGFRSKWDPGKDPHFSHYSKGYVRMNPILTTLSFELLLFGLGVMAVFLYLLF